MEFTNKMLPCFFTLSTLEPYDYTVYLIGKLKNAEPNLPYANAFDIYNIIIRNEWFPDTYRNSTNLFTEELYNKTQPTGSRCEYYDIAKKTNSCKICMYNPYHKRVTTLQDGKTVFLALFLNKENWKQFQQSDVKRTSLKHWYYYFNMSTKKFKVLDLISPITLLSELDSEEAWLNYVNAESLCEKILVSNKSQSICADEREHLIIYLREQKEIASKNRVAIQRNYDSLTNTLKTEQIPIDEFIMGKNPVPQDNPKIEENEEVKEGVELKNALKQTETEFPAETKNNTSCEEKSNTEENRGVPEHVNKEQADKIPIIDSVEEFQILVWNREGLNEARIFIDACEKMLFCCKLSGEKYLVDISNEKLLNEIREMLNDKKTRKVMRCVINISGLLGNMVHDIQNSEDLSILEHTTHRSPGMYELINILKGKYTEKMNEADLCAFCENIFEYANELEHQYLLAHWKANIMKGPIKNLEKIEQYQRYYNAAALFSFNQESNRKMDFQFCGTFSFCKDLDTKENRIKIIDKFLVKVGMVKKGYREMIKFSHIDTERIEYYANDQRFLGDHKDLFWRGMTYAIWEVLGKESKPEIRINGERLYG